MICFLLYSEKNYFYFWFPSEKKKPHTKKISSWGHELTSAHSDMLVIPTWFLLFNSLSLLNLRKINSMGIYQATRAVGK